MKIAGFSAEECFVSRIDSFSELKEKLSTKKTAILIGDAGERFEQFYYFEVSHLNIYIGICTRYSGSFSGCVKLGASVLVYSDENIFLIDSGSSKRWEKNLASIIYDVAVIKQRIVLIEEIGLVCYDFSGKLLWQVHSPLIENHKFDEDEIEIFTEGTRVVYSAVSGEKIR